MVVVVSFRLSNTEGFEPHFHCGLQMVSIVSACHSGICDSWLDNLGYWSARVGRRSVLMTVFETVNGFPRALWTCHYCSFYTCLWLFHLLVTWYSPMELYANLRRQLVNENRDDNRSRNPNIPRMPLDRLCSTNRDISDFAYKAVNREYSVSTFLFCSGLPVVFSRVRANWIPICNYFPFVAVMDQIPYTNFESKYYGTLPMLFRFQLSLFW